ncbi:MAG: FtsW/RodA/SpoVE family cell cycle protein, partial [Actinobacteria bacterium]|nr:FtsW/RodA/SpoVE family cell cycle protein [Actinomycetota bacterium]
MASRSTAIRKPAARAASRSRSKTRGGTLHLGHPAVLLGITTLALVLLGLVMILSASSVTSFATYGSSFMFFQKQLMWAAIGLAGFALFVKLDYHRLKGWGYALFVVSSVLMLAVLIPGLGMVVGGSSRWLRLGPLSFQPSELAKLGLVLFAADVFSRKKESTFDDLRHTLLPMLPAMGILVFLVMMQPDLGTTMLLGAIGMGMLFVAGAPLRYVIPIGLSGAGLAVVAALSSDYRRERVLAFMNPWKDPLDTGYH